MIIIPAKFQPSSPSGMDRKSGDRLTCDVNPFSHDPHAKKIIDNENSKLPPLALLGRYKYTNLQ